MGDSESIGEIKTEEELSRVLERARAERWTHLGLLSHFMESYTNTIFEWGYQSDRIFLISVGLSGFGPELSSLRDLRNLALISKILDAEGVRHVSRLSNLISLDLGAGEIGDEGAKYLSNLSNLTWLNLGANGIGDEGAKYLSNLSNLTWLNLFLNHIGDEGAKHLSRLSNLTTLDLGANQIGIEGARAVFDAWADSPTAAEKQFLALGGNEGFSAILPPEVLLTRDAQRILAAYRSFRQAQARKELTPLNQAKMLVVGNEAVGKTSLVRYLIENIARDPSEQKTPGIAISEKIETQSWSVQGSDIRLNVWDFGGQEIMHGTHRFFLTRRSLYLVVLEARREDDRSIFQWMKTVRNRGGEAPVIVVINKCEGGADLRLDETALKRDYPNIKAFVRTSCDPGEQAEQSIAELREVIGRTLVNDPELELARNPIPEAWMRVKDQVAELARQRRVLPLTEFERLCHNPNVSGQSSPAKSSAIEDPNEQRALLGMLHDLGVVVAHGLSEQARAASREITLLDPNWLTTAIYTVINRREVLEQGGEFSRVQLGEWLDPSEYPVERHEFIIDMMKLPEVGLCFELPGSNGERFLIPAALPTHEPDYGNWPEPSLRFRYSYEFLPTGLLPRFIVQAHQNLTDKPTRWLTGVVLQAAGCRVLVQANLKEERIDIRVSGPQNMRRSALNIVLNDLEMVHRINPEIGQKPLVPLPDNPELEVPYDHLLVLEEREGSDYSFYPHGANRSYKVSDLLEGVRLESRFSYHMDDEWRANFELGRDLARRPAAQMPALADTPRQIDETASEPVDDKRSGLAIVFGLLVLSVLVLVGGLTLVRYYLQSNTAFVTVAVVALLLTIILFISILTMWGRFTGTQAEKLFVAVIAKIPGLSLRPGPNKDRAGTDAAE